MGAGAVVGATGVDGRTVDEPVVVAGDVVVVGAVATVGPLHGAHRNRSAKTAMPAMTAIMVLLMPPVRRSVRVRLPRFRSLSRIFASSVAAQQTNCDKLERFHRAVE